MKNIKTIAKKCFSSHPHCVKFLTATSAFLIGALLLSLFSLIQKSILGIPLDSRLQSFIIPIFFGGMSGLIIGVILLKLQSTNSQLNESQDFLQDFLDNASELIQSVRPDGKIFYTNQVWQQTLGYTPTEIEMINIFDIIAEEDRDHCQKTLQEVLNGKTAHVRFSLIAKDQALILVDGWINCHFQGGQPVSTRAILRNITREIETERALQLSSQVFEHVNDGIFIANENGVIVAANKAFTNLTLFSVDEMQHHRPNLFINAEDNQTQAVEEIHNTIQLMKNWQGEVWIRRKDQEIFPAALKLTMVKDSSEKIRNFIGVITDITSRRETELRLRHLATHDILTGLPNRLLFVDQLQMAVWRAERDKKNLAIIYLDLDGFKAINDTHGHAVGDSYLKATAKRLQRSAGKDNIVARFGGDEFAVLLGNIDEKDDAVRVAEKVLKVVSSHVSIQKNLLRTTASIGISLYPECKEPDSLLSQADTAMYASKAKGKNAISVYSDPLQN